MRTPPWSADELDGLVAFVEERHSLAEQQLSAAQARGDSKARDEHMRVAKRHAEVRAVLKAIRAERTASRGEVGVELVPADLEGLPAELIQELSLNDSDQQELEILKLIEKEGGVISLDLLLVRWFQSTGKILKRKSATTRLYRMQSKGRIFPIGAMKGVYSLKKQDAAKGSEATQRTK